MSGNVRDVTKRAIIDVNSSVSGIILTSIIAQLLTIQQFLLSAIRWLDPVRWHLINSMVFNFFSIIILTVIIC